MSQPENVAKIPDDFAIRLVRPVCHELHHLIELRGYEDIVLDFSDTHTCFSDALLPMIASITHYREEGVTFSIIPPQARRLYRTFESANWLHLIEPQTFPEYHDTRSARMSASRFHTATDQHVVVTEVIDEVLRLSSYLERIHLRALEWSLNEITDNVLTRAESSIGGIIQLSLKPVSKEIEFVVADFGIGIPRSLREGLAVNWSDVRAVEEAVKEGVTRGTGQGNGLFGSLQIAAVSGGAVSINSGQAYLVLSRVGKVIVRREGILFPGISVGCSINYGHPLVLERALSFSGTSHEPVDILELNYEQDDSMIIFQLRQETESTGSRISSQRTRQKLENILRMTLAKQVTIDCTGVPLMSSSFSDEFFVKLVGV